MSSYSTLAGQIAVKTGAIFGIMGAIFIPFPFGLFHFQSQIAGIFFADTSSDSHSLYILVAVLITVSLLIAFILTLIRSQTNRKNNIIIISRSILPFYLALLLFKYGFDKIFKSQFYIPEPNTLYTPMGMLDKDILFWSVMGTSRSYCFFLGLMEIIPAILLCWRRTRPIGLLMALPVLLHVSMINFSFDISVKLFSGFLLFLNLYLIAPYLKSFFYRKKIYEERTFRISIPLFTKTFLTTLAISLIMMESLWPYLRSGNFNDDEAPRPYLHGAYAVLGNDSLSFKRVFIHRRGYMVFQAHSDSMKDYRLEIDSSQHQMLLTDYQLRKTKLHYQFSSNDSLLEVRYPNGSLFFIAKGIDWRNMAALRSQFHWVIED